MKKLLITGAAAGLLLVSAAGAFARFEMPKTQPLPTTYVTSTATLHNNVLTVANTGLNQVNGAVQTSTLRFESKKDTKTQPGSIVTGGAGAESDLYNTVNSNTVGCGCSTKGNLNVTNTANLTNNVLTLSNSGLNQVNGGGKISTGAVSALSDVANVVNTNVVGQ
jgi:hypothetical protein